MIKASVSIVVPTHRRPEILACALASVKSQTYVNWECVVISDFPDEWSLVQEIVESQRDSRFRFLKSATPGGNASRNLGIKMTQGDYVFFLDDDDLWLRNKVEEHIKAHKVSDFVFSSVIMKYECKDVYYLYRERAKVNHGSINSIRVFKWCPPTSSCVSLSRGLLREELWDETLKSYQDWDLWYRLLTIAKPYCINKPLVVFTHHSGERTSIGFDKRKDALGRLRVKYPEIDGVIPNRVRMELLKSIGECSHRKGVIAAFKYARFACRKYKIRLSFISIIRSVITPRPPSILGFVYSYICASIRFNRIVISKDIDKMVGER